MRPFLRLPISLWCILAVALALRIVGAASANLIFDERAHLALAETIDLRPGHLHLVSRSLDHPLLSIYVLKLSGMLFGTSDFGLRVLHLIAGGLTVIPVYYLGKRVFGHRVFGHRAGLWAAGLLAVDQFHASWSRVFMPEVLMLLAASLAMLQLLRALERDRVRDFALLGALLGLAYLAKETAILLLPAFWLYLLVTPAHRRVLLRWPWYLTHGVFLLVIAPDVIWNLALASESYLYRDVAFATEPWAFSLKSLSLYLGEVFRTVIGPDVLDPEYAQSNLYVCHWPAGVLYLAAMLAVLGRRCDAAVRLLLVTFGLIFAVFLVIPGGNRFEPYWWASVTLIPAVVCAGWVLDWAGRGGKVSTVVAVLLLAYLGGHYLPAARRAGPCLARATVGDFVVDFLRRADAALERGDLSEAESRYVYVLNIGGPNADAYVGLGRIARAKGRPAAAEALAAKALQLDPNHAGAIELQKLLERSPPSSP